MKVLHIITGLSTGGAERALFNLLSGGLGDVAETAVLSLSDEGTFGKKIRELGVPVMTVNMKRGMPTPLALFRLRQLVNGFRPDLIQGWMYHGNLAASVVKLMTALKPKVVWNVRQTLYSLGAEKRLTRQVIRGNRFLSNQADAIIYNSQLARKQHESFGFATKKALVIPNGFDTSLLQTNKHKCNEVRRMLGIEENEIVIGHVARFHPMKNHAGFLQAALQVLNVRDDVSFLLVGREVGLGNLELIGIVPAERMEKFHFLGEREDVYDVMAAMDVFCMSSAWGEAFPNVLAEAMSMCLSCVTTDVGDSREIVGDIGVITPARDNKALASGLLAMLGKTEVERQQLGKLGRLRVERKYALAAIVGQYAMLYEKVWSTEH